MPKESKENYNKQLRQKAERKVEYENIPAQNVSRDKLLSLFHELKVHQVELEMQNEHLRQTQSELENSREKYTDLFDFAPVGYFVLNDKGLITEVNLTATTMLGRDRTTLLYKSFVSLILREDSDSFYIARRDVVRHGKQRQIELRMQNQKGKPLFAHVLMQPVFDNDDKKKVINCRLAMTDITERKLSESELAHKQRMFIEAEALSHTGAWQWDIEKDILNFSDEWLAVHGCKNQQLKPAALVEIAHPDDRARITKALEKLKEGKEVYDIEHRIVRQVDKQERFIHARGHYIKDDNGKVVTIYGFSQDITERRQAEQKVARQAELLQSLFNNIPVMLVLWDAQLERFNLSSSAEKILGWTTAEANKGDFIEKVYPDEQYRQQVVEFMRSLQPEWRELAPISQSGEPVPSSWYNIKLADDTMIGIGVDLREIKKAQQKAEESEHRLRLAAEAANFGTYDVDLVSGNIYWSPEMLKVLGLGAEAPDHSPGSVPDLVHPDDRKRVNQKLQRAYDPKGSGTFEDEHRVIKPDGSEIWVLVRGRVEFAEIDGQEKPVRSRGVLIDITKIKEAEQILHEAKDYLEQKIQERTENLRQANSQLKYQAELLDLANEPIIVHDLEGRIIYWNRGAERTYGWEKHEVVGKITHEILKTGFSVPLLKVISAVSMNGSWQGELTNYTKQGKELTVESHWVLRKDEKGNANAILEIDRDITEKKAARRKIDRARRFAVNIIQNIQEGLLVLDSKFNIISANKSFYEMFDLEPVDVEGQNIYKLCQHQWDIPELRMLIEKILPENTVINEYEMEYTPGTGMKKILTLNAKGIQNEDQNDTILLAICDITKRRQQEQRIRDLTEQLLLAEEENRQKVATDLHDTICQLLAFSSRELESFISAPDRISEQNIRKVLDSVKKSTVQCREIIADLSSPTLHIFGLETAFDDLAEKFRKEHGIDCSFASGSGKIRRLDKKVELLLYRSVKELLCNVAKHAEATETHIRTRLKNGYLEIEVSDNGCGFDADKLKSENQKLKSFGLFSVEQRLTNIGGLFDLQSEKNSGTMITMKVPFEKYRST